MVAVVDSLGRRGCLLSGGWQRGQGRGRGHGKCGAVDQPFVRWYPGGPLEDARRWLVDGDGSHHGVRVL